MRSHVRTGWVVVAGAVTLSGISLLSAPRPEEPAPAAAPRWNARAAAEYLDGRERWWLAWPNASRDHGTVCVSCHTALPYALARPALTASLHETETPAPERTLLEHVEKRVRLWNEIDPWYPDQTRGLPHSSESRGSEAVLNALVLARRDARAGSMSDDGRAAFEHMWKLQFRAGDLTGGWAWMNFHNEPWEGDSSPYFGASLATIAVGTAPGGYASSPEARERVALLREYLRKNAGSQPLLGRVMGLWASSVLPETLPAADQRAIVDAVLGCQREDGGWSLSSLGSWPRRDGTKADTRSDGFATGVIVVALQRAGDARADAAIARGVAWLVGNQDPLDGHWPASSLNKQRDPSDAAAPMMSDAATAYAVLALTRQ